MVKIFLKDNIGWAILSFSQNLLKRQRGLKDNIGWTILSSGQKFLRRLYGLNCIILWSKCCKKAISTKPYCVLFKIFNKDRMGWSLYYFDEIFRKRPSGSTRNIFSSNFLKRQYELNHFVFCSKLSWKPYSWIILSFDENCSKRQYCLNHVVFWSKLSSKTIRIERYCRLVKIF